MKKQLSLLLAFSLVSASAAALSACGDDTPVLRVASWEEYIDEGGDDSYAEGSDPLYEEFEDWYFEQTGEHIRVEYIPLTDNEEMYNRIQLGDTFDLLCPSEYMIMKLAAEDLIQPYPESFYDVNVETNYYAQNVSPYIAETFSAPIAESSDHTWADYAAGYMWGTTGFVFNPENANAEDMKTWDAFTNPTYNKKITAKNNVRDSYFSGLGIHYEDELLELKSQLDAGTLSSADYQARLSQMMNDTTPETMSAVETILKNVKGNIQAFETDEAKNDFIAGRIDVSYQWSGDAVYIMDEVEAESGIACSYVVPEAASNLWFDGWVMMKDANVDAATMFVNFVSRPDNVVRNMYYIGYTSCVAGEEVFDYVVETYGAEEGDETAVDYDLNYFFGEDNESDNAKYVLSAPAEQLTRQLFAQYPDEETMLRCVVMQYFDDDANTRANTLWQNVLAS